MDSLIKEAKKYNTYTDWIQSYETEEISGLDVVWNKIRKETSSSYPNVKDFWDSYIKK